jgi:hypothetical protein
MQAGMHKLSIVQHVVLLPSISSPLLAASVRIQMICPVGASEPRKIVKRAVAVSVSAFH